MKNGRKINVAKDEIINRVLQFSVLLILFSLQIYKDIETKRRVYKIGATQK